MERNLKNEAISRIISLIENFSKQLKGESFGVNLTNVFDGCVGTEQKLRLTLTYKGRAQSQIVSECLPLDDVGEAQEAIRSYCEKSKYSFT